MQDEMQRIKADLVKRATAIAEDFMSRRTGKGRGPDQWSDLFVKVSSTDTGIAVDWRYRHWYRPKDGGAPKNQLRYLPENRVTRLTQDWERDEVTWVRDALRVLKESYRELTKLEKKLGKAGVMGDEADMLTGFVPVKKSKVSPIKAELTEDKGEGRRAKHR